MANVVDLKINSAGARAVLNSPGVQSVLLQKAQAIADSATAMGCDCTADVQPGSGRAHAMVKTQGVKAARNNAKHNTLLKALGAGR